MKKIAACYIRVSTDDQTELSPDSQLEALKEYAETHDYIIPEEYIYKDEGISGRSAKKRPAFNTMIGTAKIKPKPFDAVLLWKFSRFARNRTDAIVYKNLLRNELGIDVYQFRRALVKTGELPSFLKVCLKQWTNTIPSTSPLRSSVQ